MSAISQNDVFTAANEIAATGIMPTRESIYRKLGRGSATTLHKYLTEWRVILLKQAGRVQSSDLSLAQENLILRQNLEQLTNLLTANSAELNGSENKIQELENHIKALKKQNHEYQIKIAVLESTVNATEKILEGLKDEMRQIHQDSIEAIRQNADRFHEQLMIEKIKVINLEEKLRAQMPNNTTTSSNDFGIKKIK